MKLQKIDKQQYKQRLNRVQAGLVIALFGLSLALAELYRYLLIGGESSFMLNAAGVATAAAIVTFALYHYRNHPYMAEVVYAWRLKQALNKIYRSSKKVDAALVEDNPIAVRIRYFSLHASAHLYQLEDNTLTMPELNEQIVVLDEQIERLGLNVSIEDYSPELLSQL